MQSNNEANKSSLKEELNEAGYHVLIMILVICCKKILHITRNSISVHVNKLENIFRYSSSPKLMKKTTNFLTAKRANNNS